MDAQFLCRMRPCRLVDVGDDRAGTGDDATGRDQPDLVHLGKRQDDAAGERHGLAVIAGAGAARGDGDAAAIAGFQHADQLGFRLRRDDDVAGDRFELLLQDRAVPVEVAALLLDDCRIVLDLDAGDVRLERRDIHQGCPTVSSSSE